MTRAAWYEFGPFRVDVTRRLLARGNEPVAVTARTFDTLVALLERRGEMVDKETLMTAVWADTSVEEGNLTQQISLLRKALGEQPNEHSYVATVPRRGYRFVAPVRIGGLPGDTGGAPARHIVGRDAEREVVTASFRAAAAGRGRMICLTGEPGIGKTTVAEMFLAQFSAGEMRGWVARGRCSERLAGTDAYLPILEALDSMAAISKPVDIAARMRTLAPSWWELLQPASSSSDRPAPSQERLKRELTNFFGSLAAAMPGVLFLEDLQWADESTADVLGYLATRLEPIGCLILCSYRPTELVSQPHPFLTLKLDLQSRGICTDVAVRFLSRADVEEYLRLELAPHAVPDGLASILHAKTEGNPLFLTDLVRDMRARGILSLRQDTWSLTRPVPEMEAEWPQSVRSMVERAVTRLGENDLQALSAASVQGLEFDSVTISRALDIEIEEIEDRLDRVERRHALLRRSSEMRLPSGAVTTRYVFVHALYQNALHGMLPRARRAAMSGAIADALRDTHRDQGARIAQQLAVLYVSADRPSEAATQFNVAAQQAIAVAAPKEAVALTRRGLSLIELLPAGLERDRQELALLITLGVPLAATTGYANREVEQTYARARALAAALQDGPAQFAVLWGMWVLYHVRADLTNAREIASALLAAGEHTGDPRVLQVAHTVSAYTIAHLGELPLALDHLRRAAEHFRPEHHRFFAAINALDPSVAAPAHEARVLWLLGEPDAALARAGDAIAVARSVGSPNAIGFALVYAAYVHQMRNEPEAVLERTREALALAVEHGLADVIGWATVWRGWAEAQGGDVEAAVGAIRRALAAQRSFGSEIARAHQLALLADVLIRHGRLDDAGQAIAEGLEHVKRTGDRYYEPELHRLGGQLKVLRGEDGAADFAHARATAQAMHAEGLARRARQC